MDEAVKRKVQTPRPARAIISTNALATFASRIALRPHGRAMCRPVPRTGCGIVRMIVSPAAFLGNGNDDGAREAIPAALRPGSPLPWRASHLMAGGRRFCPGRGAARRGAGG